MSDSIYRLRAFDVLTLLVLALLAVGVIMVQSASQGVSGHMGFHLTDLGQKQLVFSALGVAIYFVCSRVDYARLLPRSRSAWACVPLWLLLIAGVACAAVLVPHVGIERNGARRWLPLGFTTFQPSELAKWAVVIFLAWVLTHRPLDVTKFRSLLLILVPVCGMCLLVVIQDFGTAALIAVVALSMLLAGRVKLWHLGVIVPPALAAGFWFVRHKEYRWRRMIAFMNPYAAPQGEGYHMIQSLLSYATGGTSGTGLGGGIQKLGYLPEDTTDFIFSTLCEETGLFGAGCVIALYLFVLIVAWQAIRPARDGFGRLLAFGIAAMVGTQAMINIAVATVSVPTKGLSLPLISAGGSGLVITCAAMGVLASVLRHVHPEDQVPLPKKSERSTKTVDESMWSNWTTT